MKQLPEVVVLRVLPDFLPQLLWEKTSCLWRQRVHEQLEYGSEHVLLDTQYGALQAVKLLARVEDPLENFYRLTKLFLGQRLVGRRHARVRQRVILLTAVVLVVRLIVVFALYQLLPIDSQAVGTTATGRLRLRLWPQVGGVRMLRASAPNTDEKFQLLKEPVEIFVTLLSIG